MWLPNSRGTPYSRRHTHLSVDSDAFWDFSFVEMAQHDFPATLHYVLSATGAAAVAYVG